MSRNFIRFYAAHNAEKIYKMTKFDRNYAMHLLYNKTLNLLQNVHMERERERGGKYLNENSK